MVATRLLRVTRGSTPIWFPSTSGYPNEGAPHHRLRVTIPASGLVARSPDEWPPAGGHSMGLQKSITLWLDKLRDGDSIAAEKLWEQYFDRMLVVARRKLGQTNRPAADEEDVALSAFKSFCIGAQDGRFGQLTDRTNLWPLLVTITANKAVDLIRYDNRQKRGGPGTANQSASFDRGDEVTLNEVLSTEPTPEFAAQLAEELDSMMAKLKDARDPDLPNVAMWRMSGETNDQIAERLGCARRTVERKLRVIATLWSREVDP